MKKLYLVIGVMAVLIAGELFAIKFAMGTLSAARAFVGGESLWSKAQKDAVAALQRFARSGDEEHFDAYLEYLRIPEGDRKARTEIEKANPDFDVIRKGFLQGGIHPDDILPMVQLLRRFHWTPYLARAIEYWKEGDQQLIELNRSAEILHGAVQTGDNAKAAIALEQIREINDRLTKIESEFSYELGEGSRWLESVVLTLLALAVLLVEGVGLTFAFLTSRQISRGLQGLNKAADRIGQGNFTEKVEVRACDEIGTLGVALDRTRELLQKSYGDLESRVQARTQELAALATENERLYREARAAVAQRDEFLSIGSHELRTPVAALSLHLSMLERLLSAPMTEASIGKARDYAGRSVRQIGRIRRLLDDLLDLSRLRVGKLELRPEPVDLCKLLQEACAPLVLEARERGSQLTVVANSSVHVLCDPLRITQVATNLLVNAIKYGEGKPIEASVEVQGDCAILSVRDHGIGIEESMLARIFDRFERVGNHPEIEGLGLGLYISKHIVDAHGGELKVESRLGKGSTFTLKLKILT